MENNKSSDFQKFTSRSNDNAYDHKIKDILSVDEFSVQSLNFESRASAIEICLHKLGYGDHTKLLKDTESAANCMGKLKDTYQTMLYGKVNIH